MFATGEGVSYVSHRYDVAGGFLIQHTGKIYIYVHTSKICDKNNLAVERVKGLGFKIN
jgi:hypothetical protein